jgi:hypothetical protein
MNDHKMPEAVQRYFATWDLLREVNEEAKAIKNDIQTRYPNPTLDLHTQLKQVGAERQELLRRLKELRTPEVVKWEFVGMLHGEDHASFEETGNAGFVWRTWQRTRKIDAPMPAWVLDAIDDWASRVVPIFEDGGSPKALIAALGLTGSGGGPGIARRMIKAKERRGLAGLVLAEQDRDRDVAAEAITAAILQGHDTSAAARASRRSNDEIFDLVAKRHRVSSEFVRNVYYKYTESDDTDPAHDQHGLFAGARRLRTTK